MNCPSCGTKVSDGARFCPKCGTKIGAAAGNTGGPAPQRQPQKQPSQGKPPKQKKAKSGLIFVLVFVLVVAACGCGGYVGYRLYQKFAGQSAVKQDEDSKDKDWDDETKPQKEKTTEETTEEETTEAETLPPETTAPAETTTAYDGAAATTAATTAAWDVNGTQAPQTTAAWDVNGTAAAESEREFIIADSSSRYLTSADVAGLTSEELRLARNEIYARHGRKFKDEGLQAYFDSKSWYVGTIEPEQFKDDALLNDVERKNLEVIKAREAVLN